jgi:glycosyltransferase involved in cell wall biosynthesis
MNNLRKFGWKPSVLTADGDTFSHTDESLLKFVDPAMTVVKTAANEPFNLYRSFLGKTNNSPLVASETISTANSDWKHKLSIWIRMNLFVPDARIGWYFSAVIGGRKLIEKERPNAIISIGPPHSSHLIGKRLSRQSGIPHIPVLIDPWVDIVYYKGFRRNPLTLALDNYFERTTLRNAAKIIFVTKSSQEEYQKKYPWISEKSHVLYWGYNEENFTVQKQASDFETVLHAGNIFDYQNPAGLWRNIRNEIGKGRKLRVRFVGTVSPAVKRSITEAGLDEYTEYLGFLPYQEVVQEMMNASFLLVCATEKRHVPGKLFEYLRTGNRIIAYGDDNNEVGEILSEAKAGVLFPYHDDSNDLFDRMRSVDPDAGAARVFSRENIARQLAELLKSTV